MSEKRYDYAIIGAGISGLSYAYYTLKKNPKAKIVILEKSNHLGGKIKTHREGGFLIEEAPDCFLSRKTGALELCAELDILENLLGRIPENNKTYVKHGQHLYPLPAGITGLVPTDFSAIEACEFISREGRSRFLQEPTIPVLVRDEEESIAQFISRRFGEEMYEKLIEPLMAGIYGGDGRQLSLNATFPQLRALEKQYGSVILGLKNSTTEKTKASSLPPFVSFQNGMGVLIEALMAHLKSTEIALNHEVLGMRKSKAYYELQFSSPNGLSSLSAKKLIFACEAHATAKIMETFSPELSRLHQLIPYGSSVLVNFAFKKSDIEALPEAYGYLIPRIENPKILACTFSSQKWPHRAPQDSALIRVYMNRYKGPDVLADSDEAILKLALEELSSTLKITRPPILTRVYRYQRSMPQYLLGHELCLSNIQAEAAQHEGLHFIGAAYQGVGIPDCITLSRQLAE